MGDTGGQASLVGRPRDSYGKSQAQAYLGEHHKPQPEASRDKHISTHALMQVSVPHLLGYITAVGLSSLKADSVPG